MKNLSITALKEGFLVETFTGDDMEMLAALSNGRDLSRWIAKWSGAKVDIFDAYEPRETAQKYNSEYNSETDGAETEGNQPEILVTQGDGHGAEANGDHPDTPPQEPQDSDPEPKATEVPDEPESAPAVVPDADKVEAKQTIDRQAIKFADFLDKRGAAKKWVKASYTDISVELNITAPVVKSVIDHAKEMFPRLRSVRVMSGEEQGNNFTFNKDIPEPEAPVEKSKPAESMSPDDAVLKFLRHRQAESGLDEFTATFSSIASATGLKLPAIVNIVARLGSKDIIHKVRESNGIAVWRFVEAEVAA